MLLLFAGCYSTVLTHTCEVDTYVVEDDEVANHLGVSASDVLSVVLGSFRFVAQDDGGTDVPGSVDVARGAGPAIATDATLVAHESRGELGFGITQLTWTPECHDTLEVPVDVAFATDDDAISFALEGVALPLGAPDPDRFEVLGDLDPDDTLAFPEPSDPSAVAGLALQWTPEGFDHVSLWWDGTTYQQILETP